MMKYVATKEGGCSMGIRNEKGAVLVLTLLVVVVLLTLGSVFVLRAVNEWNTSNRERMVTQSFYIAEGGAEAALEEVDTLINTHLLNTISAMNPSTVVSNTQGYVASGDGLAFLVDNVLDAGSPQFTLNGAQVEHSVASTGFGAGSYSFKIIVTEKSSPTASGLDQWDFPYYFRVESAGVNGGTSKNILLVGDFTVQVQRDNFAKYALFTNQQTLPNGTNVWFTDKTDFAGPIHTNARYNIALNPSGTFDGLVSQVEQEARFYNSGWPILLDADSNGIEDLPTFNAGFNRGVSNISLASSVQQQDVIDQATGNTVISGNGVYVPNNGVGLVGGIYVEGDATVNLGVNGSNNAVYTVTQGAVTKIITVDGTNNQTTIDDGSVVEVFSGAPDGIDNVGTIIYVNGNVTSLSGTVQEDTEITISSESNMSITDHLVYSDFTPGVGSPGDVGYVPPNANGADNLLGLVTWNGDVRVDNAAPDDISIHGTLLAQSGIFQVDDYNDQGVGPRGTATLLGGVITDYYGAFGLFSGSTGQQLSGYGRNFVYDDRMLVGSSPPYFPSLNTFIAFTNDIIDKITLQEGGF